MSKPYFHTVSLLVVLVLIVCSVNCLDYVSISDYGAIADGSTDNTQFIHNALLDAKLKNLTKVYVPPSNLPYVHDNIVTLDGILLFGDGYSSWLHGSNTEESPIKLIGSNSGVKSLRLTSISQDRRTVPWSTTVWCYFAKNFTVDRIWVEPMNGKGYAFNTTLVHGVGGIFIFGCENGIISNNYLNFTYADSIHNTHETKSVQILNNKIENSGDDGIACVSYNDSQLNRDILVRGNHVKGLRWGRGISNIGGSDVIIEDNIVETGSLAAIWLSAESSYNTLPPINTIVRRNKIYRSGMVDGVCYSKNTLPSMGIDNSNFPEMKVNNIQFVDNLVVDSCLDGIRLSGSYVQNVTIAGNTFINQRWGAFFSTNSVNQIFFMGNRVENSSLNAVVAVDRQDYLMMDGNTFVNAITDKQGRIQVVYVTNAGRVQFTNNRYSQYVSTGSTRMLEVVNADSLVKDNSNSTLGTVTPSSASSFVLPSVTNLSFEFTTLSSVITLTESQILANLSLNSVSYSLLVGYSGVGGTIDTSIDRKTLTFTFLNSFTGSFKYVIQSRKELSVQTATIHVKRIIPTPTPSPVKSSVPRASAFSNVTKKAVSSGPHSHSHSFYQIVVCVFIIVFCSIFTN